MKNLTRLVKTLFTEEDGLVIAWSLVFIPLFIGIMIFTLNHAQSVTGADANLQGAINSAVKGAAAQVTEDSQAAGDPRIHIINAHKAFKDLLAYNLGLDENMVPKEGSMLVEPPEYSFLVYNMDNSYEFHGAKKIYKYDFNKLGNSFILQENPSLVANNLPLKINVDNGIAIDTIGGGINIALDRPGVVAFVKLKQTPFVGKENTEIVRWGSAKVVQYFD